MEARQARFRTLCTSELSSVGGFGTMQEKRLHAVLKNFYCPQTENQEVPLTFDRCTMEYADLTDANTRRAKDVPVADILTDDGEIIEIQTGSLYPLKKKIHYYLCMTNYRVRVVHPLFVVKYLRWMETTGEISAARRSPKRETVTDIAKELYWLSPYLAEKRFSLCLPLLEVEEIKKRDGWSRDGKKGAHRAYLSPRDLLDEIVFSSPEDYAQAFLPPEQVLPSPFTAAEYAKATKIRGRATYGILGILCDLQYLIKGENRGRAGTWQRL